MCALPYGINTVSLFAHVFLVMLPAKLAAEAAGAPIRRGWRGRRAWWPASGPVLIELLGSTVSERIRSSTPRAALLSTLAGIALTFIAIGFLFRTFARPIVGLATLAIILLVYFGRVRFRGGLPGGLVAVALGTVLRLAHRPRSGRARTPPGGHLSIRRCRCSAPWSTRSPAAYWATYLSVILPMGLFNVVGSLAEHRVGRGRGRRVPDRLSLAVNGVGTLAAARSARASRPPSTSATRAGRRWAPAPATRCSTARS